MGVVQHMRLTPLILQAETFEPVAGHDHAASTHDNSSHAHAAVAWSPSEGLERTFYTSLASAVTGAGFAALLAGVALVTGRNISRDNGWIWGICGFLAVALAPAISLPPELPGMLSADVILRQVWWVCTIVATGAALWLLAYQRRVLTIMMAFVLLLLPHIIGAPQPADSPSQVPAHLIASFITLSLGANALMWLAIGTLLGFSMPRLELDNTK
jgi:cobalt transporter subunit CbtA